MLTRSGQVDAVANDSSEESKVTSHDAARSAVLDQNTLNESTIRQENPTFI
jgi:hypothetical protein